MAANNLQGKAIVTFIIEKDGSLSNIKVLTAPSPDAVLEAERVITLTSGKWMPGLQNHQYVRVQYTLPISFALEGKVTGITLAATSPDTGAKRVGVIRIIGASTTNDPLYILDGNPITAKDMKLLNPSDIESISILKDESAKVIYGAKATNGVVVITTKKPKATPDKAPQQK